MKSFKSHVDEARLKALLERYLPVHNEFSLATLRIWDHSAHYSWDEVDDYLWLYGEKSDYLYFPMGREFEVSRLKAMSDRFRSDGKSGTIYLVPAAAIAEKKDALEKVFVIEPDRDNWDYIYEAQALVELKGRLLQKKKNLLKQFLNGYSAYEARQLVKADQAACFRIIEEWCGDRNCSEKDLQGECQILRVAFELFDILGLAGQFISVEGKAVAFTIYTRQNPEMATVLFERALSGFKGGSQAINWMTAKAIQGEGYRWINRCQDVGVPGLRQAKQSYDPSYLYEVYRLVPGRA